ncbi:MAG: hypothetical protein HQM10_25295 [Candidatus Riflebacteria bacterium]|nr:hypothetical protein [Candidatus Riflebacteria bacterium]
MSFLSVLKGMSIEDNCPVDLSFSTSKTCSIFGKMVSVLGTVLFWRILVEDSYFGGSWTLRLFSFLIALSILIFGVMIMTYQKKVIIDQLKSKISYSETCFFGWKKVSYHFSELVHIEISPVSECLITSKSCMWTIKAYFDRGGVVTGVRLFESIHSSEAEEAGSRLSQIFCCPVLRDSGKFLTRAFTSQVGV